MIYTSLHLLYFHFLESSVNQIAMCDGLLLGNGLQLRLLEGPFHDREHKFDRIPIREVRGVEGPLVVVVRHPVLREVAGVHREVVQHQVDASIADLLSEPDQELLELELVDAPIVLHYQLDTLRFADRSNTSCCRAVCVSAIDRDRIPLRRPGALKVRTGGEHHLVDEDRCEPCCL